MAKKKSTSASGNGSSANLGFEAKLWLAADKLRNNMDAAEYKHVVLGLIFLKYISDTFEEHRAKLAAGEGDYAGANPEDQDEYKGDCIIQPRVAESARLPWVTVVAYFPNPNWVASPRAPREFQ